MSQNGNQNYNGSDHRNGDDLNALKLEMVALQAKVEQLIEEKQIQAQKCEKLEQDVAKKDEKLKQLEEVIQTYEQKYGKPEDQTTLLPLPEMKVQLPLENWHDVLAQVPRTQLGQIVPQIGDRRFARIVQPFLHDVGEHTIGEMRIIAPRTGVPSDRPMVHVSGNRATNSMPDWPMPSNIKNFVEIKLKDVDVDEYVLNFFEKFHKSSLFADMNLVFDNHLSKCNLLEFMPKIMPMISSINSINSHTIDLFKLVYKNNSNDDNDNSDNEYYSRSSSNESQLLVLKQLMAKTRILLIDWSYCECPWEDKIDWCCQWLNSPREDGKPRMLISYFSFEKSTPALMMRILKDFDKADNPISFFILIYIGEKDKNGKSNVPHISGNNDKTNEQLVIKEINLHGRCQMMISRHPLGAANTWIEANEKEVCEWDTRKVHRRIKLDEEYYY